MNICSARGQIHRLQVPTLRREIRGPLSNNVHKLENRLTRIPPKFAKAAARKTLDNLEMASRSAKRAAEKHEERDRRKVQRGRYDIGAARSPTPPPTPSFTRDEILLKILRYEAADAPYADCNELVIRFAESILLKQKAINTSALTYPLKTGKELDFEAQEAIRTTDLDKVRKLVHRAKFNSRLLKAAQRDGVVRPYGWNKTTLLLKLVFTALAMDQDTTRAFTVTLSKDVVRAAKISKHGFAASLQERLKKLLERRLPGHVISFWFIAEPGGDSGTHLHGAMSWPSDPVLQNRAEEALRLLRGGHSHKDVEVSEPGSKAGWVGYCTKHFRMSSSRVEGKPIAATRDAAERARQLYAVFLSSYRSAAARAA